MEYFFIVVFIVGTIYNLSNFVSDESWMNYWKYHVYINIIFSFIVIVWFTAGGLIDIKNMLRSLKFSKRDDSDSGWIAN